VHGRKLHERFFTALELVHLQLDELWANVRQSQQAVWLWTVCEAKSKLILVIQLGPRTQAMAYSVVHELKDRLKPGCVPCLQLRWTEAQVIKHRRRQRLSDVEQRLVWGVPADYRSRLRAAGLSGKINTSFVERANLALRQCVSKLPRRTWGTVHYASELVEHLYW
jgi:IS1 family transposase